MLYNNIKHDIIKCESCPLSKELDFGCTPQWGIGSRTAKIMVLNLRTSQECHLIEKPIETKYSLLLRKILEQAKLSDSDVFVTNLLKCKCELTPVKQFKTNAEICKKAWLYKELECLPTIKSIVTMGKTTLQRLFDNKSDIDDTEYRIHVTDNKSLLSYEIYPTYSLEEIFRKGQSYMDHAIDTFKKVKENVKR